MLIIDAQFCKHLLRTELYGVVVFQTLVSGDVADGMKRIPADLTSPLGNLVRHRKDLRRVFVQQNMVITEVWTAHVPMEVFRLNVKHEHIRQQLPEATGYLCDCILAESGRRFYLVCFLFLQLSDLTLFLIYSVSLKPFGVVQTSRRKVVVK